MQHRDDECHKFADGGVAVLALPQGDEDDDGEGDRGNQFAERGMCRRCLRDFFAEADDGAVDRVEPVCRLRLPVEQLDDAVSLMGFGNHVVHRAYAFLRVGNDVFQTVAVVAREQGEQGEHQDDDEAELPVEVKQDDGQAGNNHRVAREDGEDVAGVADRLFGQVEHIHQYGAGRRFLMVAGGKGQHFGKHIFADFADGHHGDPSHQIGAGKAADAPDDDEDDEEERDGPDFVFRPPNHIGKLFAPVLQGRNDAGGGGQLGRRGGRGKAVVDQGGDEGGKVAFGGGNAENGNQGGNDADFVGADVCHQAHKAARVFFFKQSESQFFYHIGGAETATAAAVGGLVGMDYSVNMGLPPFGREKQPEEGRLLFAERSQCASIKAATCPASVSALHAAALLMRFAKPANTLPGPHSVDSAMPSETRALTVSVQRTGL